MPQPEIMKKLKLNSSRRPTRPSRTNTPKRCLLYYRDCNAKVGSQEISGVTHKFGLGVQSVAGQSLTDFCQKEDTGHSKHSLPTTQEKTLHMDITRWSIQKSD